MKDGSKMILFAVVMVSCLVGLAVGLDYTTYALRNPLVVNVMNASNSDMPIEIYLDGELVDTGVVPTQGQYTYERPKASYELFNSPIEKYTVSIRAPNTIYEREDQRGAVYFVLD